jgi:DNA invertase Pin-like site-specific DNA recombinase
MSAPPLKHCAIYTRKSSEEGLEQDFNSLDAQREACAAYILSQKAEGWRLVQTQYDDGGYSGGTLNRPSLQALLMDIKAGKIDSVVVYKIDRLTRCLTDFSKLVEVFDAHGVTFVSVTQSFNTTTSMGRLTLNVLLSFAQFEREVTGERIRDKIAASKKKGWWMGGTPPLGYGHKDRQLYAIPTEAKLVKDIFTLYLHYGSVKAVKEHLDQRSITTPHRQSVKGRVYGGVRFSRGQLYTILRNPVYIGKIVHKGQVYDGQHPPLIDSNIFQQVQALRAQNHKTLQSKTRVSATNASGRLLQGCLFDEDGGAFSPTYTVKNKKRYPYYISQNLLQFKEHPKGIMARLPAYALDKAVRDAVHSWQQSTNLQEYFLTKQPELAAWLKQYPLLVNDEMLRQLIKRVVVGYQVLRVTVDAATMLSILREHTKTANLEGIDVQVITLTVPFLIKRLTNGAMSIQTPDHKPHDPLDLNPDQLERIVKGIIWRELHFNGASLKSIANTYHHGENYINKCIQESFKVGC